MKRASVVRTKQRTCLHLALSILAFAVSQSVSAQQTERQQTPPAYTANQSIAPVDLLRVESARWQLSEEEYSRYLELMKGPRGSFSVPGITPVEVLGIHAKTPAERAKYAALWVDLYKADTARVLEFQNTVHSVWLAKYPDEPLINRPKVNQLRAASGSKFGSLNVNGEQQPLMSLSGRTMFFTTLDCDRCDYQLDTALHLVESGEIGGLDIYLGGVASDDDEAIQKWARDRRLPINKLADRSITLNYDVGVLSTVASKVGRSPAVPLAVQRRGEAYELVALSQR